MKKVVLDTNVLLVCISSKSKLHWIFKLLKDEDDDKFVDCAIAANASYIVSHDKDFHILKQIEFPKIRVIDTNQFKEDLGV